MKLVWVSHTAGLGGAELCLREAAIGLLRRGVSLWAILPAQGQLAEILAALGVRVFTLSYAWWGGDSLLPHHPMKNFVRNVVAVRKLSTLLRAIEPDVVVTNTLAVPVGAFAARRTGTAHVWYIHEFAVREHGLRLHFGRFLTLSVVAKLSDMVVVNSVAAFDAFRRWIPPGRMRVVYCGVDVPEGPCERHTDVDVLALVVVGAKNPGKRQEEAVRALAYLRERGLDVRLALVGTEQPRYAAFLRKLAGELDVDDRVEMVPFTPDPFWHICRADVAVVCSRNEAFGRGTVEAMKLGKPVVAANVGATPELIRNGWNGFLYESGDPQDLARKLEILHSDRDLRARMGQNAREWSRSRFHLDAYAAQLLDILEGVREERQASRPRTPGAASRAGRSL